MKMKKLISGIVAGALAVSALASMSFNASAEETTKVLWEGSLWMNDKGVDEPKNKGMNSVSLSVLDGGESDTEGSNGVQVPAYWKSGSKLVIDFDAAATYKGKASNGRSLNLGAQIVGKLTDAWTWTQMDCYIKIDPSGNTYVVNDNDVVVDPDDEEFDQDYIDETLIPGITAEVELDEGGETGSGQIIVDLDSDADALSCGVNWYELITTMKEFDLKAADMTVKKISITGEYETPVFDQWNNNGDGSYTWTSSKGKITYDDSPEYLDGMNFDFANVLTIPSDAEVASISMDVAHSDWASVSLGVAQASDGEFAKTALSLNGTPSTESIVLEPEGGVAAGATPVFQCSFMNANCVLTISNFKVTLADGTEIVPGEDESSEVDSSSEDESSEDASSEDASSEDASSEDASSEEVVTYTVNVRTTTGCTAWMEIDGVKYYEAQVVPAGTEVTFKSEPTDGKHGWKYWNDNLTGKQNISSDQVYTITIDKNTELWANYAPMITSDDLFGDYYTFYQVNADKTAIRFVHKVPEYEVNDPEIYPEGKIKARTYFRDEKDESTWYVPYNYFETNKAYKSIYVNGHKYTSDGDLFFVSDTYDGFGQTWYLYCGFYAEDVAGWHAVSCHVKNW